MDSKIFWEKTGHFGNLIGIITGLLTIFGLLIAAIERGINAAVPLWAVLLVAISTIFLGYVIGRFKAPSTRLGIQKMWSERRYVTAQTWNEFTAAAQTDVWLLGVAELGFADDEEFHEIVARGCTRGCCYRFLLLDPSSDTANELDALEGGGRQVQGRIRHALAQFRCMHKQNLGKRGEVEIRVYDSMPHISIVRSDRRLLITQYVWPRVGNSCYTYLVQDTPKGIFKQYLAYFELMWENSKPITHPVHPKEQD